ncbi:MAG: hypothetical protein RL725_730, partial [Actinomycetota bacterium]
EEVAIEAVVEAPVVSEATATDVVAEVPSEPVTTDVVVESSETPAEETAE